MSELIQKLRADTPATKKRTHLNNAGAALQPSPVLQAVQNHLRLEAKIGGYEAADREAKNIARFYQSFARLLHCQPRNIAFASSASHAYANALSAIRFRAGDVILTTENDYISSQIAFLSLQKRMGVQVVRARDTAAGGVDVADFQRLLLKHRPVVAAVAHVPTNSGLVQPVEQIGKICRENETLFLLDACQSLGQMPLDVERIGCDFLTATCRKFLRGPRGTGVLFVSDRVLQSDLELLLPDMRSANWTSPDEYEMAADARRFEYWETSPALLLGSRAAADYALDLGLDWIENRVKMLASLTRRRLAEAVPGIQVLDVGEHLCGIVTAYHPSWGSDSQRVFNFLTKRKIHCRISTLDVARIDFARKGVPFVLRISPHYFNLESEIEVLVDGIRQFQFKL